MAFLLYDWGESNDADTILLVYSSGKAFARVSLAFFRILRFNQEMNAESRFYEHLNSRLTEDIQTGARSC